MRFYTKEYYKLMMSLDAAELYEPVIDKEYSEEEIQELYQRALDRYIEEERASYDEPPEFDIDEADDPDHFTPLSLHRTKAIGSGSIRFIALTC